MSAELSAALSRAKFSDLPPEVVAECKRAILDWLGSALAGSQERPARIARQVAESLGGSDESTVFGGGRAPAAVAAFANGVAAHILELDDVHKGSTLHAGAPVISAAFAVAERERASGEALLLAVAVGYDAALRAGEAVNPSHYRFWHPTGTAATFGAAAAAGSLLRLDEARLLDALGSAGTQAAGLWEFNSDGAMSKHLHPGKAALNGILAADLAAAGFTGATRILEGERGFFRAMSASYDASRVTDRLGQHWKVSENWYKAYACCGHTHTAIDCARELRARRGWRGAEAVDEVAEVVVELYGPGYSVVKEGNPRTPYAAQFSAAYCVATALLEGTVPFCGFSQHEFSDEGTREPDVAALLSRTRVTVSEELTAEYPEAWPARVVLTLRDGAVLRAEHKQPLGSPENPLSTAELEGKFVDLVSPGWGERVATRWVEEIGVLERAADVGAIVGRVQLE